MNTIQNKKSYLPSIDGLRAIAIILVLAYHFDLPYVRGGFIGVDIFFVLSGYLITCHLLLEWQKNKTFDLKRFWLKRARRLLPAVSVLLFLILLICLLFFPASFKKSWDDGLAAIFYVSNWWYIVKDVPYFETFGAPSPFKHLWSLAIEAQFYLLWPIGLLLALKGWKKRQRVLTVILVIAAASALLMALLYSPTGIDRVYYGTDTRLFGLLGGCALAFLWPYYFLHDNLGKKTRQVLDGAGLLAITSLLFLAVTLNEYQSLLYRGGFVLVTLLSVLLLGVIVHPSTQLGHLFSHPLFSWLGKRSYSIYLWHYPIIVLSTPVKAVGQFNPLLVSLQLLLILTVANHSYVWLEEPIRKKGLRGSLTYWRQLSAASFSSLASSFTLIAVLTVGLWGINAYSAKATKTAVSSSSQTISNQGTNTSTTANKDTPKQEITQVLAMGDSLMMGLAGELEKAVPGIRVDGAVGRQLVAAKQLAADKYAAYNTKDAIIIVELGSNSPFLKEDLVDFLKVFDKATILLINTRVPRNWEKEVNTLLAEQAEQQASVRLIDWHSLALANPELLAEDGVHLSVTGLPAYLHLITTALEDYTLKLDTSAD